jgi:hypothetical protein
VVVEAGEGVVQQVQMQVVVLVVIVQTTLLRLLFLHPNNQVVGLLLNLPLLQPLEPHTQSQ